MVSRQAEPTPDRKFVPSQLWGEGTRVSPGNPSSTLLCAGNFNLSCTLNDGDDGQNAALMPVNGTVFRVKPFCEMTPARQFGTANGDGFGWSSLPNAELFPLFSRARCKSWPPDGVVWSLRGVEQFEYSEWSEAWCGWAITRPRKRGADFEIKHVVGTAGFWFSVLVSAELSEWCGLAWVLVS